MTRAVQPRTDEQNAEFWDELCGTGLATQMGLPDTSPASLATFDEAYFGLYPYLRPYLLEPIGGRNRTLEIGLGYGTVSQALAEAGHDLRAIDIAPMPVAIVRQRLTSLGFADAAERAVVGSALELPYEDGRFDYVYAIGSLHHTGNLAGAVAEVQRVLAPGGIAVVMVYNRHSLRQLRLTLQERRSALLRRSLDDEAARRAAYDVNAAGEAAPVTEFISAQRVRHLFGGFADVRIDRRNTYGLTLRGRTLIPRERLLDNVARVAGTDLYVIARMRAEGVSPA
jgi:SAM-dependent methyltransferase